MKVILPGIFHVRTVPDARTILEWVERGKTYLAGMYKYSGIQMVKPYRWGQLRKRLEELPRNREIHIICRSAQ
jgi:hypothetical protein